MNKILLFIFIAAIPLFVSGEGFYFDLIEFFSPVEMTQQTTPSNPTAGKNRFYFKNDDKLYTLNSAGDETVVGAGEGAGVFNYIVPNGDAEEGDTSGWTCTGNLAISATSTAPLFDDWHFIFTAAANSADDYCEFDFNLMNGDKAGMLGALVDRIVAGTGFDTGDASLRLYDLDKGDFVNGQGIIYASTIGQPHTDSFQTDASNTNYRLRLVSNVDTTFVFTADNIKLGRESAQKGMVSDVYSARVAIASLISENPTWVSSVVNPAAGQIRIVPHTGVFTILPSCVCTPEVTGQMCDFDEASSTASLLLFKNYTHAGAAGGVNASVVCQKQGVDARQSYDMSSTTMNREIAFEYYGNNAGGMTAEVTKIVFKTEVFDRTSAWDGDELTAQEDMLVSWVGNVATTGGKIYIKSFVNGLIGQSCSDYLDEDNHMIMGRRYLNKGDTLDFRSAITGAILLDTQNHWISISKDNTGTEKLLKDAKVYVYAHTSVQSMITGNYTTFIPTIEHTDTHNAFASGIFSAPRDDEFTVCHGNTLSVVTGWDVTEGAQSRVVASSDSFFTYQSKVFSSDGTASGIQKGVFGCATIPMIEGEQLYLEIYQDNGANISLITGATYNWITITSE